MAQQLTIPGGKKKGTPLAQAEAGDIKYWLDRISGNLEQDPQKAHADADRGWCAGARAELERRKGGGAAEPKPPASTSIQRAPDQSGVALVASDPVSVSHWFLQNAEKFHLVSPTTAVQSLPEGCEIAISMLAINPDPKGGGEVYPTDNGKLGLTGTSLAKISAAAGISWDPNGCGFVDNGRDSRYCEYKAVGGWRLFDGTFIVETAHRSCDLRDGSDEISSMTEKQLAQQRRFIRELTESKAKNRVIRRLGLKSGYTADELQKPFAVARIMWTGRSSDPALAREFAMMKAQQMSAGSAALFGHQPAQPRHTVAHVMTAAQPPAFVPPMSTAQLPDPDDYNTSDAFLTSGEAAELPSGQQGAGSSATSTPLPSTRQQQLPNTAAAKEF